MPRIPLRAVGATVVLFIIAIAAFTQTRGDAGPVPAPELATDTTTPTSPADPDLATVPELPEFFVYRVGLLGPVTAVNFWDYYGTAETAWNAYVWGPSKASLYSVDPLSNELIADLARDGVVPEPTAAGDAWHVSVALVDEALWSDGTPLTAADFAFTFDTVRELDLGGGWAEVFPETLVAVEAVDPHTVRFSFESRPLLGEFPYAVGLAPAMPEHIWSQTVSEVETADGLYEADAVADAYSGLYAIDAATPHGVRVDVIDPQSQVDEVLFVTFGDEGAAVAALAGGSIDTILSPNGLSTESVSALESHPEVAVIESPAYALRYLGFNLTREPMADLMFRRAIASLFDREGAASEFAPGASPAFHVLPASVNGWYDDLQAKSFQSGDPDRDDDMTDAIEGLKEGGYSWGKEPKVVDGEIVPGTELRIDGASPPPLTILTPGELYDPSRPQYAEAVESVVEALGFDVRIVVTDFDTVVDLAFSSNDEGQRQYDMYILGWTLGNTAYPDFYDFLFSANGLANSTGYDDEEFAEALSEFAGAQTAETARPALWKMERAIADDLPYLTLNHPLLSEAYRSDRVGFGLSGVLGGLKSRAGGLEDLIPQS